MYTLIHTRIPTHTHTHTHRTAFYFHGRACEQSFEECVKWYRVAAAGGNECAMANLAECLQEGRGCEKDQQTCMKWLHTAAYLGDRYLNYNIDLNPFHIP